MKNRTFICLLVATLFVLTEIACIRKKAKPDLSDKISGSESFIRVSAKNPRYFETTDGHTWIPIMINFIMPNGKEEDVFRTAEKYFRNFSENGGNAVRIWISSSFLEIEDQQEGHYDPVKFQRIDRLLEIAQKYNLKIKFTLQHIRSISSEPKLKNSWSNSTVLSIANGGNFHNIKEFINTAKGKRIYLDRVKALAKRYHNNDQVFSWELWNEMDAVDGNDWYTFSAEMLDSVKVLFPNHLVVQTLGSMHSKDAEERYEKLFTLKHDEYITLHRYLDPGTAWNQYDLVRNPVDQIVATAVQFAYRDSLMKPVLMNEIGAVEANHAGPSKLYAKDSLGILIHDMIFAPFFCGTAGCGSMWHWNDYVNRQNLWYVYRRFNEAIKGLDPIKEKFYPFFLQKDSVRMYGLKGLKNTVIWCRDARNNWKTELEKGIVPQTKTNFTLDLQDLTENNFVQAKSYNPWTDTWLKIPIDDGKITIPSFVRSVVIVLRQN